MTPDFQPKTMDQIERELAVFSDAQRSLAWMPEPPFQRSAGDCRSMAGGLDYSTRRSEWVRARYRLFQEVRRNGGAL